MTTRKSQRWEPTRAALARRNVLWVIADGRWHVPAVPISTFADVYNAVLQLERRGLIEVDRENQYAVRVVYPEQAWLLGLEEWFEWQLGWASR